MTDDLFQHSHRVTYADCTAGNHVYYARYLDFLEAARGEFFRHLGFPLSQLQDQDRIFPVIECHLRYKSPARYDDALTVEIWPAAVEQGRLAGANMAGHDRHYGGLLSQNTLYVGDTRVIAGGLVHPTDDSCEVHVHHDPSGQSYRRLLVKDGRLVGVILVGQVEDAGVYLNLIYNRTPLPSLPADPRGTDFQVGRLLG